MPSYLIVLTFAWLAILVGGWLGWQLLRQNGRLLLRLEELEKRLDTLEFGVDDQPTGLALGTAAPAFDLSDLAGERKSLGQYRGKPVLLIFFNPACGFCRELLPILKQRGESRGQRTETDEPLLLMISTGGSEANRALFDQHKLDCPVLLQKGSEVAEVYNANGTPSGYLINTDGKIASELAMGAEALLALANGKSPIANGRSEIDPAHNGAAASGGVADENRFSSRSVARSKIKRDGLKAGTPAPQFRLSRLDGRGELALSELRGRQVLLVFSSPGCGPCNTLAPQLEKFHRERGDVQVIMISKGEPKENRAKVKEHGLTFPIVLQQQWEVSRRYAMFATPIAYLIDEHAIISHDVAVGVEPILALMGSVAGRKEREPLLTV